MKRKPVTFIETSIPPKRGIARHYEHNGNFAQTVFDHTTKLVKEVHTPQDAFRRLHEVLHARHTDPESYKHITHSPVKEIIEDCRLHMKHWPWKGSSTPKVIADDVDMVFKLEEENRVVAKRDLHNIDPFADFAQRLRLNATYHAMSNHRKLQKYATERHAIFASNILELINNGRHEEAAYILEEAFFGMEDKMDGDEKPKPEGEGEGEGEGEIEDVDTEGGDTPENDFDSRYLAKMEVIELPLTQPTDHNDKGFRLATSGGRIYRPALRRPLLPQRLFIKTAPVAPGGAVLMDASDSMGVCTKVLLDCCIRAPAASIAVYSGNDVNAGTMYIFARDGNRAETLPEMDGGNSVDGPAMDWLMKQNGPRMFITDRGFCGSSDSTIRSIQLHTLEELGEITVYESYEEFQKDFPPVVGAT